MLKIGTGSSLGFCISPKTFDFECNGDEGPCNQLVEEGLTNIVILSKSGKLYSAKGSIFPFLNGECSIINNTCESEELEDKCSFSNFIIDIICDIMVNMNVSKRYATQIFVEAVNNTPMTA